MTDIIFGDTLAETVAWIVREAVTANTADGYRAAYHQLHGIDRLHTSMRVKGGGVWGLHDSLALTNTMHQMSTAADDPALRARLAGVADMIEVIRP